MKANAIGALLVAAAGLGAQSARADMENRWLELDAEPGEYISGGVPHSFGGFDNDITLASYPDSVVIDVMDAGGAWKIELAAPIGAPLVPGEYADARRFPSEKRPMLHVSGQGRSCEATRGWFEILPSGPGIFQANFKQHCDGSALPLYGAVRISTGAASPPPYRAIAGSDRGGFVGDAVMLDGTLSYSWFDGADDPQPLTYAWSQVAGPAVVLQGAATAQPTFVVPVLRPGGADFEFQLTVSDPFGRVDTDSIRVHAPSKSDRQNFVHFTSEPGDPAGSGREIRWLPEDGGVGASEFDDETVFGGAYDGIDSFKLFFQAPAGAEPAVGAYENAVLYPATSVQPGLSVLLNDQGCDSVSGRIEILDLARGVGQQYERFAADFEQHCDGLGAGLTGEIRVNYLSPSIPVADAGPSRGVEERSTVVLDASGSTDAAPGSIAAYAWMQIEGPTVTLAGANTAQAQFTAPDVGLSATLRFELMVTDDEGYVALDTVTIDVGLRSGALDPWMLALLGLGALGRGRFAARAKPR